MPQICASVKQTTINNINGFIGDGETFSETVAECLELAVFFQKNPVGKLFLTFGDKIFSGQKPEIFTKNMTNAEAVIFREMLKNVKASDMSNWGEKVKLSKLIKRLL